MTLFLPVELRARIESEARAAFPRECCGLIEGIQDNGAVRAVALHPARNVALRADRFEIAPEDHFAELKAARANGRDLVGCYHSHPNGEAKPSASDAAGAGEENFLWVIASLTDRAAPVTLAAFVYSATGFLPEELVSPTGADFVTSSENALS
jgi:desampylase